MTEVVSRPPSIEEILQEDAEREALSLSLVIERDTFSSEAFLLTQPVIADFKGEEGLAKLAIYNPSAIITMPGLDGYSHLYFWARVEPNTPHDYIGKTEVRLFELTQDDTGAMVPVETKIAHKLVGEDPCFTKIGDTYLLGIVELDETTIPTTVFYEYDPQTRLCRERLRGPYGQKDVRIAMVDPDDPAKGLVVYGRPDFGNDRRRITRTFLKSLDASDRQEQMNKLTVKESRIDGDLLGEFPEDGQRQKEWAGVNSVGHIKIDGETYRILWAHRACFTEGISVDGGDPDRLYEAILLLDTGDGLVELATLATSKGDFADAQTKAGRLDLSNICFPGGGVDGKVAGPHTFGVNDREIGVKYFDEVYERCIEERARKVLGSCGKLTAIATTAA